MVSVAAKCYQLPITKGYIYLDRFTTKNEYWGWTMMEYGQKKQKQ
jgi:hypothetical protein